MTVDDFLCPRLVGKRFESHAIPLELLGDLAALQAMIIEVARWRYLQENPDRKRSPRKFTDGVTLALTGVEDGSAVARIALVLATSGEVPEARRAYLEQARDAVIDAVGAADEGRSPAEFLPIKVLAYFDRLGRSLQESEAIELASPQRAGGSRLTRETRLRLLKAAQVAERTEEVKIRGGVFAFDQEARTFAMRLADGSDVSGPVGSQHFDAFLDAFNGYRQGVRVLLDCVAKYNRADRLERVESVEHATLLDPLDFPSQLDELRALKKGWYDGKGVPPSAHGLDWLSDAFGEHVPEGLPLPHVYPVAEGGVRFEWLFGRTDASLEIDIDRRVAEWHALQLDTDEEDAKALDLGDRSGWDWLVSRLQDLSGAPA